ncbi:MAG: hypothetical protein E6G02_07665 [Actinobacteria bacterium]|jgi:hypothetical protein|nr:MAG: hypothetical protein E6G02_07665 [Actinomycetota bacterium]
MRALIALGVMVALLGALAAQAPAATNPTARKIAVLQKQVKTLQKQVKLLTGEISANYAGDACGLALTADTFQVSWGLIDTHNPPAYFGAQTQVDDKGACAALSPAVPRSLAAPPKTSIFQPLINWINP